MSATPDDNYFKRHSREKRVAIYPRPKYKRLIIAFAFEQQEAISECMRKKIESFFDSLPVEKIAHLQWRYEQMTPEERKNPKKYS